MTPGRRSPIGWEATAEVGLRDVDLFHLHWPEWLAFDDLAAHLDLIAVLRYEGLPIVWTAHNLTPHDKRAEVYDPIYAAWAAAADGVIHHTAWGEERMRARTMRPDFGLPDLNTPTAVEPTWARSLLIEQH